MSSRTLNTGAGKRVHLAWAYCSHMRGDAEGGSPNHSQPPCSAAATPPSSPHRGPPTFSSWASRNARSRSARSRSSTWQATSPLKCSSASSVVKSAIWNGEGYNRVTGGRRHPFSPQHPPQDPRGQITSSRCNEVVKSMDVRILLVLMC